MTSDRRAARRMAPPATAEGIPADLAEGPCVEVWADPGCGLPQWSAWRNWHDARDEWMTAHGLDPTDYKHLPRELYTRAPYSRKSVASAHARMRRSVYW
jgi:hypothetical protein